ncbi:hypothetical protein CK219_22475 [Mesorhizobium sp. WSM4313]|nr:hypothetical protein CK219_22475 [Mesorhizobium sp. WSM4313]
MLISYSWISFIVDNFYLQWKNEDCPQIRNDRVRENWRFAGLGFLAPRKAGERWPGEAGTERGTPSVSSESVKNEVLAR